MNLFFGAMMNPPIPIIIGVMALSYIINNVEYHSEPLSVSNPPPTTRFVISNQKHLKYNMRKEITALHESLDAIEKRQVERETLHFDLVDERLKELSLEAKKGF